MTFRFRGIRIKESVCSFLNRFGGDIFLSVLDDGTVSGIPRNTAQDETYSFDYTLELMEPDRTEESADKTEESADKIGESADKIGESADKTGESADKTGESADNLMDEADFNRDYIISDNCENPILMIEKRTKQEQEKILLAYLHEFEKITSRKTGELLGVKQRRARSILKDMVDQNILKKQGNFKNTEYMLNNDDE